MKVELSIAPERKRRAERLAEELGAMIPGDIEAVMWSLPLLERLNRLVDQLRDNQHELHERLTALEVSHATSPNESQ